MNFYKNILVKMPNWLGDACMGTPILTDLKNKFPDSKLTALCQSNVAPLLENNPFLDELLTYKKQSGWLSRAEHTDVIDSLKKGEYDLGVLLTNSFSSAWWLYRGDVKERIGFATSFRSFLLTKAIPFPKNLESTHLVKTYKALLKPLGIEESLTPPALYLNESEIRYGKNFLQGINAKEDDVIIGINPGAAYGTAKCWLPDRFKEVTERLLKHKNLFILYFGDSSTLELTQSICKDFPQERVINLAGKTTLRELMALLKICKVLLTNDSGPMHIASALGVPLVALFGSTNDTKTGPYNGGTVIHKHVECSPCYKKVCPIDFRCMKRITSDEVLEEILKEIQK